MANILMIMDGMQDIAYDVLDGKTPYDYGKGKYFTAIETASKKLLLATTPAGFEPDTKDCTLTLLGVQADEIPRGRSYLEALAEGVDVGDNDIIMRCNFVEIDEQRRVKVPCCNAPQPVAEELLAAVRAAGSFLKPVGTYKSLQVIKGARTSFADMVTYPPHNHSGEALEEILPHGNLLADSLAEMSRVLLEKHFPYTVFNWGQAVKEEVPLFTKLHGISGAMVTKTAALEGIARAMQMECPVIPTATGDTDTDLGAKARATLELARRHDFVLMHVGGTDEATHRQNPKEKADFIAKIDKELLGPILEGCAEGDRILLTCDHAALCSTSSHTSEPVLTMLWQKGTVLAGDMGLQDGTQAISILMNEK